jgi:acetyl-CoA C-acetyltransferase
VALSTDSIAVVGIHHTPYQKAVETQSLEEMVFAATRGALADAGVTIHDIDAVVLSTTDQVEGRVIESMVVNGAAGGVGRDVTTVASSGEHAFAYAYLSLLAGQADYVLVAVWSKESEGLNPAHADWLGAEPFLLRRLGLTSVVAAGLQASAYAARYGLDEPAVRSLRNARVAAATTAGAVVETDATGRMVAWPLTDLDLPRGCDMACAAVLTTAGHVRPGQKPAWIRGIGWATECYDLSGRDLSGFESLAASARMALGTDVLATDIDVLEIQEISTVGAFGAAEAIGLAPPGGGARAALSATVNPSGGNLFADPGNASGFLRILQAAQQIRGAAGAAQVHPRPRTALAAAVHGFAGQGATVVSFTADQAEAA